MRAAAAALVVGALLLVSAVANLHAATREGQPPAPSSWQFDDEEAAAGWGRALRDQSLDVALTAGFLALAFVSFFRKSTRLKTAALVLCVVYLGVLKSQLISLVNVFAILHWNLPVFRYSLAWYLFAVATIVSTVLWGRVYCGRMCAFGAVTQLLDRVAPARWRVAVPPRIERHAAAVKYGLLGATIVYFLATRDPSIYRYVEPFWMFTGRASPGLWMALAVLLAASLFVRNLYCRFLCPLGAFLGLISHFTVFRIKRWRECNTCKICENACEWGAIDGPRIIATECVRCDDCERLYADTSRCPHWIVIRRRAEIERS